MTSIKVCIVCAGNICRSPIAETVFRSHLDNAGLGDRVRVNSAGTGGWHVGDPADERAVRTLRANGYAADSHRAQRFQPSWFDDVDLVLALDRANFADLRRLAPDADARRKIRMLRSYGRPGTEPASDNLDVPDPYYGDDGDFDHVLRLIEKAAVGFVAEVQRQLHDPDGPETSGSSAGR